MNKPRKNKNYAAVISVINAVAGGKNCDEKTDIKK